jgi:hypothetical protein
MIQRIQKLVKSLLGWFKLNRIQTFTSLLAIMLAIYALTKDSIRDNESSQRYSESVNREKKQHQEIMDVYAEQKKLLLKYNESADLMLGQLKTQAEIAKLQFENQKIITQPGVNINKIQIQDTLNTSLEFEGDNWIMPEVVLPLYNFGNRTAKDVTVIARFISPIAKNIHYIKKDTILFLYPKATIAAMYYPVINSKEKNFFLIVIDLGWTDKFNNNKKIEQRLFYKCLRQKNNFYLIGTAEEVYQRDLLDILDNPSKVIISSEILRKYMYDVYHR